MIEKSPENITSPNLRDEDRSLDLTLRPKDFKEYVGQEKVKENLHIFLEAAKRRKEPIEHVLLYGPAGLGKTSLAHVIAKETGASIRVTSGPAIERAGDLASILTGLEPGDILFIDEIHRLNRIVEEVLYPAMEDFALDIVLGKGPGARTVRLDLPRFTLIGATTKIGTLSAPLRDRFGMTHRLGFYTQPEMEQIVDQSSKKLAVSIDRMAKAYLAKCARQTPRVANRLLKRSRDYAEVKHDGAITEHLVKEALNMLDIDEHGLDHVDRDILITLIDKFNGGPAGIKALAATANEEEETIEDVYEPFLLQSGLLERTPRGRLATSAAYKIMGRKSKPNNRPML